MERKKRVLCAMSGGVDSSLAAALLLEQGYEVIGVTMQIWPDLPEDFTETSHQGCCSLSAVDDARSVANRLGIPYYVLNFQNVFEEKVIDYFADEYSRGRTPNPCIACNRYIKFDALLFKAQQLECDYVATGHYARVAQDDGRWQLKKAANPAKDQTYVLFNLTQDQLARTLFPLGDYPSKELVRDEAAQRGFFRVADKPDSQEICFIPDNDYGRFLEERVPEAIQPGQFVTTGGQVLGEHKGIAHYTVGQRKGLGLAAGRPLYVVDIDVPRNLVVLGSNEEVFRPGLEADDMNWIAIPALTETLQVTAKIRSTAKEVPCTLEPVDGAPGRVRARFDQPQRAVTPGQAVVFYQGDRVVGGGYIDRALEPDEAP